jgi:hypothetical protein
VRWACRAAVAVAVAVALAGCSAAGRTVLTPGCAPLERVPHHVTLDLLRTVAVAQACPRDVEGSIRGPVRLTATREGLRIQFGVVVESFEQGPYRDDGPERDVVVVFPAGTGPGEPAHELSLARAPYGYDVDDTIPWGVWGLDGPAGTFQLVCAIFDRYRGNFQVETRVTLHVVVRAPRS